MRGDPRLLAPAALATAMILVACGKEVKRGGVVPVDTAAVMPMLDTTPSESTVATTGQADSLGADSAGASPPPATSSVVSTSDSVAGDLIFHGKGRCFTCHGERGQGTPRLGTALSDGEWLAGNGSLTSIGDVITHGVAVPKRASVAMPAYSGMLTASEIAITAAYVYTLSHPRSTAPDSIAAGAGGAADTDSGAISNRVPR